MKAGKITSQEVAQRAGVSQSAVSRVFTPGASVSQKTIDKVRKASRELDYRPNVLARAVASGKSRIIGFLVAYLDNQFYPESLQKLSESLQNEGYHILIFTVDNKPEQVANTLDALLDFQVDAIIAASVSLTTDLTRRCHDENVPIILYNRSQDDPNVSFVTSNNIEGGKAIAYHFAEIGVKRPAYIAGWEGASTQRDREIGFRQGLKDCNLELFAREVGNFSQEQAQIATRKMLDTTESPDAIFVANDHMAFAVMDVIRHELGLKIPEDICVAGYDDVTIATWPSYNLTSVRQPANRMVKALIEILMEAITNPNACPIHHIIEGPLIIRGSTQTPKKV